MGWFGMPGHTRQTTFEELFSQSQYKRKFELLWKKEMQGKGIAVFSLDGKVKGETIIWADEGGELMYKPISWVDAVKYIPKKWIKELLKYATEQEKENYEATINFRLGGA